MAGAWLINDCYISTLSTACLHNYRFSVAYIPSLPFILCPFQIAFLAVSQCTWYSLCVLSSKIYTLSAYSGVVTNTSSSKSGAVHDVCAFHGRGKLRNGEVVTTVKPPLTLEGTTLNKKLSYDNSGHVI